MLIRKEAVFGLILYEDYFTLSDRPVYSLSKELYPALQCLNALQHIGNDHKMEIETSSAVKVFFPGGSLLSVFYEAVANSLDANATDIDINIYIKSFQDPETLNVTISDNGDGFNDESFNRFKELLNPKDNHHKGLGRLVFLKYFDKIYVDSKYYNGHRKFCFKKDFNGDCSECSKNKNITNITTIKFTSFNDKRIKEYKFLKPIHLKNDLINHLFPTFYHKKQNNVPLCIRIDLKTEESNSEKDFFSTQEIITGNDLPILKEKYINDTKIDMISSIKILYCVEECTGEKISDPLVAFNIDGRVIRVNYIPKTSWPIGYRCIFLFESDFVGLKADSAREKITLPDGVNIEQIKSLLKKEIAKILKETVPSINALNKATRKNLETKYPHLLGYFDNNSVGIIDKEETLDDAQNLFFQDQKSILECSHLSDEQYRKSLELSSRSLTEYILYRDKIINKLDDISSTNSEEEIHNLIVPRFNKFESVSLAEYAYQNNAWLLDDKFMSFRTIMSDKRMDALIREITPTTDIPNDGKRPDIAMIFTADPEKGEAVDVVIIEIKKKTDSEKDNTYVINQLSSRARKLANYYPNIQRMWYYGIIDINSEMGEFLKQLGWQTLFSHGRLYYRELQTPNSNGITIPTPVFLCSFESIVKDARSRNHTFLEILKNSLKKHCNR